MGGVVDLSSLFPFEKMAKILVADDRGGARLLLNKVFTEKGHQVKEASDGKAALKLLQETHFDLVLTDLRMPGIDGMALLQKAKEINPILPVMMITAYGTVDLAVEAMKKGAADFITKPFNLKELEIKVEKVLERRDLERENRYFKEEERIRHDLGGITCPSPKMKPVYELIRKVAPQKVTVLIHGESGVGKELVASAIHYQSPRQNKPFIKVFCGALAEGVLESELFGHEKGAFTDALKRKEGRFELADKGTLFLDEIGDISPNIQTKLLRVLQEEEFERVGGTETIKVDVRIIAATNKNLEEEVEKGNFRKDLYYRLNVVPIFVPPLRERKEDIPILIQYFLKKYNGQLNKRIKIFEPEIMDLIMNYKWPGNIRELENVIQRAVVLTEDDKIRLADFPLFRERTEIRPDLSQKNLTQVLEEVEHQLIEKALKETRYNQTKAAEDLGITRSSLQYKILKYNL